MLSSQVSVTRLCFWSYLGSGFGFFRCLRFSFLTDPTTPVRGLGGGSGSETDQIRP